MMRFTLLLFMILLSGVHPLAAQQHVEARGITSTVKLEEIIFGHLVELNGKYKLRATEVTFAPDAYLGVHHHVGPGMNWPPFRPDTRHNLEGLRLSSSTGLCLTTTNVSN
jgi:hypothetical protein